MERRKLLLMLAAASDFIAAVLMLLEVFLMNISAWIFLAMCVLVLGLTGVYLFTVKEHKKSKCLMTVVGAFVALAMFFFGLINPYLNSTVYNVDASVMCEEADYKLTQKQAMKDLDYCFHYVRKVHPALMDEVPAEMQANYDAAYSYIGQRTEITTLEMATLLEPIVSVLGDAHTYVRPVYPTYHYMKYIEEHNRLFEDIVAVNGIEMEDLLEQNRKLYSFECESGGIDWLCQDVSSKEGLAYLGIRTDDGVVYTYETEEGKWYDITVYTEDYLLYEDYLACYEWEESDTVEETSFVSYEIDLEHSLALLSLTSCDCNDEYLQCLKAMFTEVKENNIQNVAVDVRYNGGGSSLVCNELFRYLDVDSYQEVGSKWRLGLWLVNIPGNVVKNNKHNDLLFSGDFYVLTSRATFSSAMMMAEYAKDNQFGTIIGTASSNDPNSYGDVVHFTMPNSHLFMQVSSKKWIRVDQNTNEKYIEPDISCPAYLAYDKLIETIESKEGQ
ncbi:MAG TPA: S41 family peptidase [Lachnospiraceae bacterium]|nr:S41 family peptidase [Lachnospiraceae bacterium]